MLTFSARVAIAAPHPTCSAPGETAYQVAHSRLRDDIAVDSCCERRRRGGAVAGIESLRCSRWPAESGAGGCSARALAIDPTIVPGDGASPLSRYSGIAALAVPAKLRETEVVERVLAGSHRIFVLTNADAFDNASRRVVELLQAAEFGLWIGSEGEELSPTAWFVLSPRLEARRALDSRKPDGEWIAHFVTSPAFDRYLDHAELP